MTATPAAAAAHTTREDEEQQDTFASPTEGMNLGEKLLDLMMEPPAEPDEQEPVAPQPVAPQQEQPGL